MAAVLVVHCFYGGLFSYRYQLHHEALMYIIDWLTQGFVHSEPLGLVNLQWAVLILVQ